MRQRRTGQDGGAEQSWVQVPDLFLQVPPWPQTQVLQKEKRFPAQVSFHAGSFKCGFLYPQPLQGQGARQREPPANASSPGFAEPIPSCPPSLRTAAALPETLSNLQTPAPKATQSKVLVCNMAEPV